MRRRSAICRVVVLIAAASVLAFALVAGAHIHQRVTAESVTGLCQICSVGQARADLGIPLPAVCGLLFLGWSIVGFATAAPAASTASLTSPRAPPLY